MKVQFSIAVLGVAICLAQAASVEGRGFGGSASRSGGSYSGSHSASGGSEGHYGGGSESYNRSYEGSHGGSYDASGTRGAAYGPNGAAAGGTRNVTATGPDGRTYSSNEARGAAAGPNGAVAGGTRSATATGANGQTYSTQRYGAAAATRPPYGAYPPPAYGAAVVAPAAPGVVVAQPYVVPVQTQPANGYQPATTSPQPAAAPVADPDAPLDRAAYLRARLNGY